MIKKPIILCDKNAHRYNYTMKKIDSICYPANNWKDIEKTLKNLSNDIDPLKSKREKVYNTLFENYDGNVSKNIVDTIKKRLFLKK